MRTNRPALWALLSCALASPAAAQFHDVAFTVEHGVGWHYPDTTVAASPSRVVIATNHRLELRNRDGSLRADQSRVVGSTTPPTTFPFELSNPSGTWRDTRAEYDSANDRLWVIYWEGGAILHIAVSKDGSSPDTWDDWHYFTGSNAIDLGAEGIPTALQVNLADHPIINIDEGFFHISVLDNVPLSFERRDAIASIPLSHSGGSMLSGDPVAESDIEMLQLRLLQDPLDPDDGMAHYPVQEPHEQFLGVQFFVCTSQGPKYGEDPPFAPPPLHYDGVHTQIRLAARYLDSGVWKWIFRDMDIASSSPSPDHFFSSQAETPDTPKSTWQIAPGASQFESAVLARNVGGAWRIFAGHHVVATAQGGGQPVDTTDIRYYVIDPDIAGFPGSWTPSIEVVGRAPTSNIAGANTYNGAIAVNVNGQATITFTRSGTQSPAGWPSLVRARLTSNYTATQYEISAAFAQGPRAWYATLSGDPVSFLGGDYADMQAAPNHCGHWAIGTIVAYIDHEPEPAVPHNKRAIWLTEIYDPCSNNAEMNGDGVVDLEDYNLYLDHYAKGTPQADMDGDGKVDSLDYLIYSDEYAKR